MTTMSAAFRKGLEPVLLALADDELVIGHRHSEWTGWAPHIEEDIAFSSIAQDEIGHASLFYKLLSEVDERSADQLALGREPSEYRHAIVCERPNRDWAFTLARHFLYESADRHRLESLTSSAYKPLAGAVDKILREERYHQLHANAWFRRLAGGPIEARQEFGAALTSALPEVAGVFETFENESVAIETGIWPTTSETLMQSWLSEVTKKVETAGLRVAPIDSPVFGGRHGRHSDDFVSLWDDLTKTYREEPTATW